MNNVLLGALPVVDAQVDYSAGSSVSSPLDKINIPVDMVTLPADTSPIFIPGGPAGGGGDISMERLDIPVELPTETKTDETPKPGMSKKNMMLIGIGALVLGYLILRKK